MRSALTAALAVLLLAAPCATAQKKAKKSRTPLLGVTIDMLLDEGPAAQAHWGILAVDLKDGRVIFAHNEHRLFTPASNTKLFTTATALETLGPSYKFRTTVESSAAPDATGAVPGLTLVGRGDPNLSPRVLPYNVRTEMQGSPTVALDKLVDQLVASGVHSVTGDIVGDDTYFIYERYGDGWTIDDTLWSYGAPVSALTVNDNNITLSVDPGDKAGDPAHVRIDPFGDAFEIDSRVETVAGGSRRIQINREPGSRRWEVWGQIPLGEATYHETLAADDPAELSARYLREALIARGITVYGVPRARHRRLIDAATSTPQAATAATEVAPAQPVVLAAIESIPLSEDLRLIHKVSQNLHTEMLLRTLGHNVNAASPLAGGASIGLAAVRDFLKGAGLDPKEFAFYDGSGLSRGNLVAPAATVKLLTYMDHSANSAVWHDTLPVAGVDGSLLNRLTDTCTISKVQAKTGTLRHVSALSGYITTSHGRHLVFSVMVNGYNIPAHDATNIMDHVLVELCKAE